MLALTLDGAAARGVEFGMWRGQLQGGSVGDDLDITCCLTLPCQWCQEDDDVD